MLALLFKADFSRVGKIVFPHRGRRCVLHLRKADQLDFLKVAESAPAKPADAPKRRRHYFRCKHCLTTWAADIDTPPNVPKLPYVYGSNEQVHDVHLAAQARDAECPFCHDHGIEHMGRVEMDRLVQPEFRVPCDAKCTNAKGPKCDCKCGGENHGTQALVMVNRDGGSVRFAASEAKVAKQAGVLQARKAELDAALGRLDEALDWYLSLARRKAAGAYLSNADFHRLSAGRRIWEARREALAAKQHHARIRKLTGLVGWAENARRGEE